MKTDEKMEFRRLQQRDYANVDGPWKATGGAGQRPEYRFPDSAAILPQLIPDAGPTGHGPNCSAEVTVRPAALSPFSQQENKAIRFVAQKACFFVFGTCSLSSSPRFICYRYLRPQDTSCHFISLSCRAWRWRGEFAIANRSDDVGDRALLPNLPSSELMRSTESQLARTQLKPPVILHM